MKTEVFPSFPVTPLGLSSRSRARCTLDAGPARARGLLACALGTGCPGAGRWALGAWALGADLRQGLAGI